MATYKKGFKKQSSEQVLLKVIVGIIVAVFVIVLMAFVYDKLTVSRNYDDFDTILTYETMFTQKDADSVQIPDYLIYFYNDTCESCISVKAEVLKLAEDAEKSGVVIFFVNTANTTDDDTFKDAFLLSIDESSLKTPMVVSVVDGAFEDKFIGTDAVKQILVDVEASDYTPFN